MNPAFLDHDTSNAFGLNLLQVNIIPCDCESTPAGRPSWRGARGAPEHAHESLVSSGARSYGTPQPLNYPR